MRLDKEVKRLWTRLYTAAVSHGKGHAYKEAWRIEAIIQLIYRINHVVESWNWTSLS